MSPVIFMAKRSLVCWCFCTPIS